MVAIIITFIIFGFLIFLCICYISTYDERQEYKLKKMEAVKRSELHEILKNIEHIDNVVSANSRSISQYVYQQEQKQLNKEKENKQRI